eukprot:SAG22_NODE_2876_length_2133_cov_13.964110_2_plen_76_part_00
MPETRPDDLAAIQQDFPAEYAIFVQLDLNADGKLDKDELWDKLARFEEGVANKICASWPTLVHTYACFCFPVRAN